MKPFHEQKFQDLMKLPSLNALIYAVILAVAASAARAKATTTVIKCSYSLLSICVLRVL